MISPEQKAVLLERLQKARQMKEQKKAEREATKGGDAKATPKSRDAPTPTEKPEPVKAKSREVAPTPTEEDEMIIQPKVDGPKPVESIPKNHKGKLVILDPSYGDDMDSDYEKEIRAMETKTKTKSRDAPTPLEKTKDKPKGDKPYLKIKLYQQPNNPKNLKKLMKAINEDDSDSGSDSGSDDDGPQPLMRAESVAPRRSAKAVITPVKKVSGPDPAELRKQELLKRALEFF